MPGSPAPRLVQEHQQPHYLWVERTLFQRRLPNRLPALATRIAYLQVRLPLDAAGLEPRDRRVGYIGTISDPHQLPTETDKTTVCSGGDVGD